MFQFGVEVEHKDLGSDSGRGRGTIVNQTPSYDNGVPMWRVQFGDGRGVWTPQNELSIVNP